MALTTFLFDLDGTLIDSIELIIRSYQHTIRTHRQLETAPDVWMKGLGIPLRVQFKEWSEDPAEIDAMVVTYREYNLSHHDEMVTAYDGVVDAVKALRNRGKKVGLVTSKVRSGGYRGQPARAGAEPVAERNAHVPERHPGIHRATSLGG